MSDFPNDTPGKATFSLRPEQQAAIDQTYHYWQQTSSPKVPTNDSTVKSSQPQTLSVDIPSTKPSPRQFLWNAKPRFGKTFAAYEFAPENQCPAYPYYNEPPRHFRRLG